MLHALINRPSSLLDECQLTFVSRSAIDMERALRQHRQYAEALVANGLKVTELTVNQDHPDGTFVEDTAIVLDELAILTSMGSAERRPELPAMKEVLRSYRRVMEIHEPARIEGGDILCVGKTLFAGISSRTNRDGIESLRNIVEPLGYQVIPVPVRGSLHLKTAITAIDEETVLLNPEWLDAEPFERFRKVNVDPSEPFAANLIRLPQGLIVNAAFPRTLEKIDATGIPWTAVDISEFGKAEAGLTCMSLIFNDTQSA